MSPDISSFPRTVLVRMPNWLGDCVMTLPALSLLSSWLPDARIYLSGRSHFRDFFLSLPHVHGFAEAPGSGLPRLVSSMCSVKRYIRENDLPQRFDLGILFTNSISTAAIMWRMGPKIRLGYNLDGRRLFLTHPIPCGATEKSWHFVRYYAWLVKCAETAVHQKAADNKTARKTMPGEQNSDSPLPEQQVTLFDTYQTPELTLGEGVRRAARELLAANGITGRFAVFAPASAYGAVKDWPPEHYRRLRDMLHAELSLPVVVTGASGQADVCRFIADGSESAVSVAGRTSMAEFTGLLAEADLFVGGDSGGAHVAGALGIPTVVIFGVTNPTRTRPGGRLVTSLGEGREHDIKLSTPEAKEAAKKALAAILPEQVLAAAKEMLCKR